MRTCWILCLVSAVLWAEGSGTLEGGWRTRDWLKGNWIGTKYELTRGSKGFIFRPAKKEQHHRKPVSRLSQQPQQGESFEFFPPQILGEPSATFVLRVQKEDPSEAEELRRDTAL